jgi:hypothetical protein
MSLAIDVDLVTAVLLADGWHQVAPQSFNIDAYEFMNEGIALLGGGQEREAGVPAAGAVWTEKDRSQVYCPLTAVFAVKTRQGKAKRSPAS